MLENQENRWHPAEQSLSIYLEIHRLLAVLLIKNRFIRRLTHTGLSRAEVHTLIEIAARNETNITILQPLLDMDQSSVSRLVKNLISEDRIQAKASQSDRRVKNLRLTNNGRKLVQQIDKVAGGVFENFISRLHVKEEQELLTFYTLLADFYGQPACPKRPAENPIRMQQRRASRALGVLSKDIFKSGMPSEQWIIFRAICLSSYPLNPKKISTTYSIPANSVSAALDRLKNLGLISRTQAKHDSRYIELSPSLKGYRFYSAVEHNAASDIEKMLAHYSIKQRNTLLQILRKYVGEDTHSDNWNAASEFTVQSLKTSAELVLARSFAVKEMVHRQQSELIPAQLFVSDSIAYGLYDSDKDLRAVCEIFHSPDEGATLSLVATRRDTLPDITFGFLEEVLRRIKKRYGIRRITIQCQSAYSLFKKAGQLPKNGRQLDF